MYFAADIIRQYNTNNGTNKVLKKCLQNKDTQELLEFYQNDTVPENSPDQYKNEEKWNQEFLQPLQKMKILL